MFEQEPNQNVGFGFGGMNNQPTENQNFGMPILSAGIQGFGGGDMGS